MLRAIAEIARSEGEDLAEPESGARMRAGLCIRWTIRLDRRVRKRIFRRRGMLAKSVTQAARFIAERGVIEEGSPILVRFITQVASRFGVAVTQRSQRRPFR
jgi:hypothetical protein